MRVRLVARSAAVAIATRVLWIVFRRRSKADETSRAAERERGSKAMFKARAPRARVAKVRADAAKRQTARNSHWDVEGNRLCNAMV